MRGDGLLLWGGDLCSKWGFNDGDCPDEVYDRLDAAGRDIGAFRWHPVLVRLVTDRLLPVVRQSHDVEVYTIGSIHNPIRAETVDGVEVDTYALDEYGLGGVSVMVPWDDVMAACEQPDTAAT